MRFLPYKTTSRYGMSPRGTAVKHYFKRSRLSVRRLICLVHSPFLVFSARLCSLITLDAGIDVNRSWNSHFLAAVEWGCDTTLHVFSLTKARYQGWDESSTETSWMYTTIVAISLSPLFHGSKINDLMYAPQRVDVVLLSPIGWVSFTRRPLGHRTRPSETPGPLAKNL